MLDALLYGGIAFALGVFLHVAALKFFPKFHLLDQPGKYGLKRYPLPYPAGIIPVLVFAALFLTTQPIDMQALMLFICIILLATISFLDDLKGLPISVRLGTQILIGFLLFATGTRIYTITNPLGGIISLDLINLPYQFSIFNFQFSISTGPLPLWSGIFTIFWILLTVNAMNWLDGIPGQVNVLSFLGALTVGFLGLSSRVGQPEIAVIAFIVAGCALAGALFDFPPNKVVLGDTGAMFYGLMLGAITIYAGGKVATAFLVLGVPLTDFFLVMLQRLWRKQSVFRRNAPEERLHYHHRLLAKGWSERKVIFLTGGLGGAFGITALFLGTFQKFLAAILLFLFMLLLTWYTRERK